mmetsp:Transcript_124967/g.400354  ORF Transcript_124967/g.400354 Transcript_124967/m.400354 type:complete len:205 (-) Transcript_124967:445-1059(-)
MQTTNHGDKAQEDSSIGQSSCGDRPSAARQDRDEVDRAVRYHRREDGQEADAQGAEAVMHEEVVMRQEEGTRCSRRNVGNRQQLNVRVLPQRRVLRGVAVPRGPRGERAGDDEADREELVDLQQAHVVQRELLLRTVHVIGGMDGVADRQVGGVHAARRKSKVPEARPQMFADADAVGGRARVCAQVQGGHKRGIVLLLLTSGA